MSCRQAFILENNFENISRQRLAELLERYGCQAVTVALTGDYEVIYRRFLERNRSPARHLGHIVNDRYPAEEPAAPQAVLSFEDFVQGIAARGMDSFSVGGPRIVVDTTDLARVDYDTLLEKIRPLLEP